MPRGPGLWPAAPSDYLTRAETLDLLRVKLQTLYAYVSRGWIRSVPQGPNGRRRLYVRQDVERMKARADARGGHATVAAGAMRWGEPIIQSTITEITARGPDYRGVPALELVRAGWNFEQAAEHLWATGLDAGSPWRPCLRTMRYADALAQSGRLDPARDVVRFLADVALSSGHASHRTPVTTEVLLAEARRLIATMAGCLSHLHGVLARPGARPGGVAASILAALGVPPTPDRVAAVDAALILCADHELAQSTFVARIAASAGADLGECVGAAILTQTGMTAARSYERAEDFLRACRSPVQIRRLFDAACAASRNPPGFNHPLYPAGDPRAACLVAVARRLVAPNPAAAPLFAALDTAAGLGCQPSLEAGLILLAVALGLPPRSPCGLFIVGRTAGWVAHMMEQRLSGVLLRPRARYAPHDPAPLARH